MLVKHFGPIIWTVLVIQVHYFVLSEEKKKRDKVLTFLIYVSRIFVLLEVLLFCIY